MRKAQQIKERNVRKYNEMKARRKQRVVSRWLPVYTKENAQWYEKMFKRHKENKAKYCD